MSVVHTIFGSGEQTRDDVYVEDVAAAFLAAAGGSTVGSAAGEGLTRSADWERSTR
jgi:nucleoside-diphosphate-sugar epimerase